MVSREEAIAELKSRGVDQTAWAPDSQPQTVDKASAIAELKRRGIDPEEQGLSDAAANVGHGALETLYSPFQVVGEAIRGAGEGEPLKVATAQDPTGFRAPSILQRLMPSLQTPQPPADPFQKAYQGLEGIAHLPQGVQAASDVVTGKPDIAAQLGALGLGLGLGEVGNMPAQAAGKMLGGAVDAVTPSSEVLNTAGQRLAARTTSQALDLNPRALGKLAAKAGSTPEEEVLQLGAKANELIPDLIQPLDTANSKMGKVLAAHDDAGELLGRFAKQAAQKEGASFPEKAVIDDLRTAAENYYGVDGGEAALTKTADRLEKLQQAGKLDFQTLSEVKSAIGNGFAKKDIPAGTRETYDILNNATKSVVDRLSTDNPALAPAIDKAKEVYALTSRLLPAMTRSATKEVSGASLGSGVLAKTIPAALGGMIGGPLGAAAGVGAKYLQEGIAPDLGKNLAYMAMKPTGQAVAAAGDTLGAIKAIPPAALTATGIQPQDLMEMIRKLKEKYEARRKF